MLPKAPKPRLPNGVLLDVETGDVVDCPDPDWPKAVGVVDPKAEEPKASFEACPLDGWPNAVREGLGTERAVLAGVAATGLED